MAENDRKTLTKVFNSLPEAVILLSPAQEKPISETIDVDLAIAIKTGNVGFDHFNLDYSNQ